MSSPPLPARIGKYEVLDRIAVGGMAELLKARIVGDGGFEKLVAIKKILPHLSGDASYVEMFLDEARLTARLDHPNIVQVFELGTDADTPYIAMQYVDGLDVLGLLRECARTQIRLPPHLAGFIARQILDALDFAHHAHDSSGRPLRVVHRDISPGNVLVSWRGDVKLTDFGIARAIERRHRTEAGMLKGKYGYMSPEQVMGTDLDARSDIFSMGVVLAEMVMARRLFTAPRELDALLMVRDARLDRLHAHAADFPLPLRVILVRALQRRPDDRWLYARDFRDALDEWLGTHARLGTQELATFLGEVLDAPTSPDAPEDDGPVDAPAAATSASSTSGLRSARRAFVTGDGFAAPSPITQEVTGSAILVEDSDLAGEASAPHRAPTETGELTATPLVGLIHRLARAESTGLLIVNRGDGVLKEAYFELGHPQYVNSTDPGERLGQFLVAEGALDEPALARAVAAAPQYEGRLTDAVVGLGLLTPLEVYRLLAKQVGLKLIDACGWRSGTYAWIPGEPNPWRTRPLRLDAYRIIGAGATQIDMVPADRWAAAHASEALQRAAVPDAELDRFGLGEALRRVHAMLDGKTPLAELLARPRSIDARANLLRLAFLLAHTGLAKLAPPTAS
ncbi:MAG: serine/threonine-protein kinase [Kofleriaceae bacterium]